MREAEQAQASRGAHEIGERRDGHPEQKCDEACRAAKERRDNDGAAEQEEEGDQRATTIEPPVALHERAQCGRQFAPLLQREAELLGQRLRTRGTMVRWLRQAAIDQQRQLSRDSEPE